MYTPDQSTLVLTVQNLVYNLKYFTSWTVHHHLCNNRHHPRWIQIWRTGMYSDLVTTFMPWVSKLLPMVDTCKKTLIPLNGWTFLIFSSIYIKKFDIGHLFAYLNRKSLKVLRLFTKGIRYFIVLYCCQYFCDNVYWAQVCFFSSFLDFGANSFNPLYAWVKNFNKVEKFEIMLVKYYSGLKMNSDWLFSVCFCARTVFLKTLSSFEFS